MADAGSGDAVNQANDASGSSGCVVMSSAAYFAICKDLSQRYIRGFQTLPSKEQKKDLASVGKAVVTRTLKPALQAGDPTVTPIAHILGDREQDLALDLGKVAGNEARENEEFRGHKFTVMKEEQAAARKAYYARRASTVAHQGQRSFVGTLFNPPSSLLPLPPVLRLPLPSEPTHAGGSNAAADVPPGAATSIHLPTPAGTTLPALEDGQVASNNPTDVDEGSMSTRGKRGRHGAAAAAAPVEVNSGEGGGGLEDEENGGGDEDDDDDLEKLAGSVAGCSVSSKKAARVTESVSRQVDTSLMERFRTMAANEFADAESGSDAERLWDAALRAARTEGTERFTMLLDFVRGYGGCPAKMATKDEKLRMITYLRKLRFDLPA